MHRLALVVACASTATPVPPSHHVAPDCADVAADVASRASDAQPIAPASSIDLDGDGAADPMFATPQIGGNRDVYLYASANGCPHYVGQVQQSFLGEPHCAEPATPGTICRISTMRFMIHGDEYEYFYACARGTCTEAGTGRHVDAPPKGP